jgi:arylsulfatase A-like enzyme
MNQLRVSYCFVFAVAMSAMPSLANAQTTAAQRPNILFIYADDQSYKTLSCYDGAPHWVKTPNIDRLASQGVRFERTYLGPWCMPSRASLLTGRLQHGVMSMTMEGQYPGSKYDPKQCPFIPAQLRANGYHTAQIGKWHTGTDTGYGRDWDFQIVWNRPGKPENAGNYYSDQMLTINGVDKLVEGYSTDNYSQWAAEYIAGKNRDPNKPWYLWLCYGAVHGPTTPADRHKGSLRGNRAPVPKDIVGPWPDKPAYLENTKAWMKTNAGGYAMAKKASRKDNFDTLVPGKDYDSWIQQVHECMMAVDEGVGKVIAALEASGQLENTLIVYSADQGFGLGEHGFNQKVAPYDATVSSPMIVRWAKHIPEGKVCKHPINAPDLMDLFCRTAGVTIPWKTHGRDIRPLLENPARTDWNKPLLMTHTSRNYGEETRVIPTDESLISSSGVPWYALLRHGKYKYVRNLVPGETEELYDLDEDPDELINLANRPDQSARLTELRQKTIEELRRTDAPFVDSMPKTKAELAR